MEIIGESAHRMLAYVEAVRRQGHALTVSEFNAYAESWDRKVTTVGGTSALMRDLAAMANGLAAAYGNGHRDVESMSSYLVRLRWLTRTDNFLDTTPLGKAVLREANAPLPASEVGSTLEVVIDPNNPFAYAQLMSRIGSFEQCMVVDPYLDQDQLLTLATFPTVTRILTSDKHARTKKPVFALVLGSAPHLEVRMAKEKDLHDRIVIPSEGGALMLGSSLNAITRRFGVATTLEEASSLLIRDHYDNVWGGAAAVEREQGRPQIGLTSVLAPESSTSSGEKPELAEKNVGEK